VGPALDPELLQIVRCPVTGEPLRPENGILTAGTLRYRVTDGIPVLLPPKPNLPRGAEQARSERAIVEAFRRRSSSYFSDNYQHRSVANADRLRRHELVSRLLSRYVEPGTSVLEGGAGPAVLAEPLAKLGAKHVALDLSMENLQEARQRTPTLVGVVGSVTSLPFASETFEVVTAVGCLEYVPALQAGINELVRVCQPGGVVIASFASKASPRRWWDRLLILPVARARKRLRSRDQSYKHFLTSPRAARRRFDMAGANVLEEHPLNGGLLGFPLSSAETIQRFEEALLARSAAARSLSSEFVLVAQRNPSTGRRTAPP
jgi:2-polyprenyl-6-hydroxyphenyl methylase/3-demethylubiquinone-9 3-methyltransferase